MRFITPFFPLCLLLVSACCATSNDGQNTPNNELTIANSSYIVLTQKALTYQADGNWEAWADMLAPNVEYYLPDSIHPLVGKAAVLAYWKSWPQRTGLRSWQLSRFNHIPVQSTHALHLSGLAGVYVISMCQGQLTYAGGHTEVLSLNYCVHFNAQKRIDRWYSYHNPMPMVATLK